MCIRDRIREVEHTVSAGGFKRGRRVVHRPAGVAGQGRKRQGSPTADSRTGTVEICQAREAGRPTAKVDGAVGQRSDLTGRERGCAIERECHVRRGRQVTGLDIAAVGGLDALVRIASDGREAGQIREIELAVRSVGLEEYITVGDAGQPGKVYVASGQRLDIYTCLLYTSRCV